MTPTEKDASNYIEKFSYYNPQVPVNKKAEKVGYANYLRTLIRNMHAKNSKAYVDPDRMPPIPAITEAPVKPNPIVPNPTVPNPGVSDQEIVTILGNIRRSLQAIETYLIERG